MRRMVVLFATLTITGYAIAQGITMKKSFGGVTFEMDTLTLSSRQVLETLQDVPVAYQEFKLARLNYGAAGVLGFAGGLMIALPIVSAIAGTQPQWGYAAGGALLILTSVPLIHRFTRHAQQALGIYNKTLTSSRVKTNFYFTGANAKLVIRF